MFQLKGYSTFFGTRLILPLPQSCLVTDILLNIGKSSEWIQKLDSTQLFNSEGVVK